MCNDMTIHYGHFLLFFCYHFLDVHDDVCRMAVVLAWRMLYALYYHVPVCITGALDARKHPAGELWVEDARSKSVAKTWIVIQKHESLKERN